MTPQQQSLIEFMAFMFTMGAISLPVYRMRHKIKREQQWSKIDG